MKNDIWINEGRAVFGVNEFTYQPVLDDFKNSKFIGIITYNISSKAESGLLSALKNACENGAEVILITNIPKRFPSYYEAKYAVTAKYMIDLYMRKLNPQDYSMQLTPYFNFKNHIKIVMTDNIVYWGSSNFSDESSSNFECGSISTDSELIKYLKDEFFPKIQNISVPYYKYNFIVAIANIERLIPACYEAKESLFYAAFEPWSDYDTNFEEKWAYRTTETGITLKFLRGFLERLSEFEDALRVIDDIVDEYSELDELPEQVEELNCIFEEYKNTYKHFYETISSLFKDLEDVAGFDVSEEACRKIINDYGMEAYDEQLDYYADKAMNESYWEYEELIKASEETIRNSLECLNDMVQYYEKIKTSLYSLLAINPKIDNTAVK